MSHFIIAAAQSDSVKGNIELNVQKHAAFIRAAIEAGVDVIIFPELSLTGYEPELAKELVLSPDDDRLQPLHELTQQSGITIVAGAPLASPVDKPYLGALILGAHDSFSYAKQHLHPGEEQYFTAGDRECVLHLNGMNIGCAICADIGNPSHPKIAADNGAEIYAAGVLITANGYKKDSELLAGYAATHHMLVIMANHSAPTGNWIPAGQSAIWNQRGHLVAQAKGIEQALILAENTATGWTGRVLLDF